MSLEDCPGCRHYKMFFQVAADALKIDPSCEPGKIDAMCTADAVRQLQADLSRSEELNRELVRLLSISTDFLDLAEGHRAHNQASVNRMILKQVKEMGK